MAGRVLRTAVMCAVVWVIATSAAHAQVPVLAAPTVNGNQVSFSWSTTAGATGYSLRYGVASGSYLGALSVGTGTTYSVAAPNGTYYVQVVAATAGGDVPSNEVVVQVPTPPATPTGLAISRNGTGLVAAWTPGAGGATPDYYELQIGYAPGGTNYTARVTSPGWGMASGVPVGTYYARVFAVSSASGRSAASNEVTVTMPSGGACDAAVSTMNVSAFSRIVSLTWTPIAGVTNYLTASIDGDNKVSNVPISGNGRAVYGYNQVSGSALPLGVYDITVRTVFSCGTETTQTVTLNNIGAPPAGPRTADPAPGQYISAPGYASSVVNQVAASRPDLLANSCVEFGGNNRFMFEVVKELRKRDTRWGLNVKRGFQGLSQDIVVWNGSGQPDEGATTGPTAATRNVQLFDIIGGHCGSRPGPNWEDVTDKTIAGAARAVWTLTYYLDAGYTP